MTSKLVPSNPSAVMVIRDITPNITTLSAPFARFGLFRIGGRGTIVRLTSGVLSVFSPTALTPEVRAKLLEKGDNLKYIIAPDIEHHIFVSEWARAYPSAQVIGVEGLAEKRAAAAKDPKSPSHGEQVPFATVFTEKLKGQVRISEEFDRDFEYEYVPEHMNKELVFCYKPDRTLIVADYLFNLPATEQYSRAGEPANKGIMTKLFGALMSTHGRAMGQRRYLWSSFHGLPPILQPPPRSSEFDVTTAPRTNTSSTTPQTHRCAPASPSTSTSTSTLQTLTSPLSSQNVDCNPPHPSSRLHPTRSLPASPRHRNSIHPLRRAILLLLCALLLDPPPPPPPKHLPLPLARRLLPHLVVTPRHAVLATLQRDRRATRERGDGARHGGSAGGGEGDKGSGQGGADGDWGAGEGGVWGWGGGGEEGEAAGGCGACGGGGGGEGEEGEVGEGGGGGVG
ncbi:hypothetical protein V500_07344 [Pseudogymnoascus sp. VKM F-4518 (FW-2643)]|nr:hypothetical protein V500_07344 [Pseudogymnoascus sp. VKM F-4518 (FW-2643)]